MDFGRGIKKRAKMIDKKLDQLVANPYEEQIKHSHKSIKKPLLISFGAAAACLCVVFASVGIVHALSKNNSNKGNGIVFDPNYKPNENPDNTKPGSGYKGSTPKIDLKNYVSANFGYPEFSYFSFFANNVSMPRSRAITNTKLQPSEETVEYTTNQPVNSYTDEDGKIHSPLPILSTYSFSDFLYFEFDSSNSSFLADRIGNGHIQALCVHTNVDDENVLVLKQGNKFYSCLGNGVTYGNDGKVTEMSFAASKYIEGWDIVKDESQNANLSIYFKMGKGFESASVIEVDNTSFEITGNSVYYLNYSFEISVNTVRAFIGLEADPKFNVNEDGTLGVHQQIYFYDRTTFSLEEFGSDTFDFQGVNNIGEPMYKFGNKEFTLEGYYYHDEYYISDINGDGYRDFVYCGKNDLGCYHVIVYDLYNDVFIKEEVTARAYTIWLTTKNGSLLAYANNIVGNGTEIVDYADIVWNKDNTITLYWHNINNVASIELARITKQGGGEIDIYYDSKPTYVILHEKNSYYFYVDIKLANGGAIANPEKKGFVGLDPETNTVFQFPFVMKDGDNYVFAFDTSEVVNFKINLQISCVQSDLYKFAVKPNS